MRRISIRDKSGYVCFLSVQDFADVVELAEILSRSGYTVKDNTERLNTPVVTTTASTARLFIDKPRKEKAEKTPKPVKEDSAKKFEELFNAL